jgi:hypothetical protein
MKPLRMLSLIVVVLSWGAGAMAQVHVSPKSILPTQGHNERLRSFASDGQRGYKRASIPARPMATPLTLPPATTNVGFQVIRQLSSGVTPNLSESTAPLVSVVGDFNGDGKPDVASIVQDLDSNFWLSILLSNGDGTFQTPVLTAVPYNATDLLASADLNGDGKADVVLVHANSVDVLLGNATGNFAAPVNYADSISSPAAVGLAILHGDTHLDIVVASATVDGSGSSPVATLKGTGSGTFLTATAAQHYPGAINSGILVDVNGDGYLDLLSASQFFLGSSGDFAAPVGLSNGDACGSLTGSVAVADVNGDTKLDIVSADCSNGTITVFLGNGDGTFGAGTSFSAGHRPGAVVLADMNGDGKVDAVVTDFFSMDEMVLFGNGDGTFAAPGLGYPVAGNVWTGPVVADFNGDGRPDLIIPSSIPGEWSNLVYLANTGNGVFVAPHDYFDPNGAVGSSADSDGMATADLNGDGLPDFAVGNLSLDSSVGVTVFLSNTANKTLDFSANYGSGGYLKFVALADIDGDGKVDLVAANGDPTQGNLVVFRGNGDGTFQTSPTSISVASGAGLGQLAVGDFDGNGQPDVAVLDTIGNVWVLLNNSTSGSPSFAAPVNYALTSTGWEIAAADLGNGNIDLVITQAQSTAVSILLGDRFGGFVSQPDFDLGSAYPGGLAIAQLNPNGNVDLIVTIDDSNDGMGIAVATGNGNGTFNAPILYPATSDTTGTITPFPAEVRVADLDRDGNLDLIFTNAGNGTVGVLYGTGVWDGTSSPFYAPIEFPANDYPPALLLADVNGDGALDAVVGSFNYSGVATLLNTGANQVRVASSANPSVINQSVTLTATVTALTLPGAVSHSPTGTVTFTEGGTVVGSGPATVSGGLASITTSFTLQGTHIILATYSGDANFVHNTKATLVQNVNASGTPAKGYILSATPTSATLSPGQSAAFTVTATPFGGFRGTVNFSCPSLPADVTCAFNPTSRSISSASAVSVSLTITLAPTVVASNAPVSPNSGLPLATALVGIFGCVALGGLRRQAPRKLAPLLMLIALAATLVATGCGGASNGLTPAPGTSPKVIHVMASSGQGTAQQLNINITVQ